MVLQEDTGYAEEGHNFLDWLLLNLQVIRHLVPMLLVLGLELRTTLRQAGIPDDSRVVGLQIREHPAQRLHESIDGVGWFATRVRQTPDRKEGAVEVIMSIDQKDSRHS